MSMCVLSKNSKKTKVEYDERFLQSQLVGLIFMIFPAAVPPCARGKRSVLIEQGSVSI